MALVFKQEQLFNVPLKSGAASFGKINAENANAFFLLNQSSLFSGSISYRSVTITLEGIDADTPPLQTPNLLNFGIQSFLFRGATWTVVDIVYGGIYMVGSLKRYYNYVITAIDFNNPFFAK